VEDVDRILGRATEMLPKSPTVGQDGLKTLKTIIA
jgi:hypothetical protein